VTLFFLGNNPFSSIECVPEKGVFMRCWGLFTSVVWSLCVVKATVVFSAEESFLLVNGSTGEVVIEMGPHVHKRISPCSTFKIALGLMGYDAEILKDEKTPAWEFREGYDDFLESWKSPQTPKSWMRCSCVWYSKLLTLELGAKRIQGYLASFGYGNQDISGGLAQPGPDNPAWINSSLQISPEEQVVFIRKMLGGTPPVSLSAIEKTKVILFKEESTEGWKLFGKTGAGSSPVEDGQTLEHSWFVGWIEKGKRFYPFAWLIRDKKISMEKRIPRVKQLLVDSHVMGGAWQD
jgi:beta-lactamase class D